MTFTAFKDLQTGLKTQTSYKMMSKIKLNICFNQQPAKMNENFISFIENLRTIGMFILFFLKRKSMKPIKTLMSKIANRYKKEYYLKNKSISTH